jgi:hypothetical protein
MQARKSWINRVQCKPAINWMDCYDTMRLALACLLPASQSMPDLTKTKKKSK